MLLSSGSPLSAGAIHTSKVELSVWHNVSWGRQKHNHKKSLYCCITVCVYLWWCTVVIDNKSWMPYRVQFCPSEAQGNTTTGGMRYRHTLCAYGGLADCSTHQLTYAGMVILGVTEKKVGSLMNVNLTPSPVILALPICTTTEPVEGRSELLPV